MNRIQRKIVASGLVLLAAIALIAIAIAANAAQGYDSPYSFDVFAKAFFVSFAAPSLVVLSLCLGLYLFKSDK